MNDQEARVERVLEGLRQAEPVNGLERRVLRAVLERAPGERRSRSGRLLGVFAVAPRWFAVTAAVVVMSVFGSIGWRHVVVRDRPRLTTQVQPARVPDTAPADVVAAQPVLPLPRRNAAEHRPKWASVGHMQAAQPLVAFGNHPAPEQPLTDEERLLLRLAHRAAPEDFDVLNPDARDAQARADKAEFRNFFGPPPTGDNK